MRKRPPLHKDRNLRQTLRLIGENIWEYDFLTDTTRFATPPENILCYTNEQETGKPGFWRSFIYPEDRHLLDENEERYKNGLIKSHALEYRVVHGDGTVRWMYDRGVLVQQTPEGNPITMAGTLADITERKELENKLRESEKMFVDMAANVPGVIYQWQENYDGAFSFTYVSPRLKEYFDIEPANMDSLIGYLHPDDISSWRTSIEHSNATGLPWKYEGRLLYPDGSIKWWRAHSTIAEKNDQCIVYNGIMTDITEEMNLRQAMEIKKEEVKRQMLQAVVSAQEQERELVSHELHDNVNQLLATAKLIIGLINVENEGSYGFIEQAKASIDLAMSEIRDISHGLNSRVLSMIGLTATVGEMLLKINTGGKIQFTLEHFGGAMHWLEINKEAELAVFRIIQSQLGNILKHSFATSATISLSENENFIELGIKDNGVGFDLASIKKGLGLINIYNRAELVDGEVILTSGPGQGCTLLVRIPQKKG
ncbi:MAG: PAS domain-containing protein [Bacteroidota bacterium]